MPLNINIDAMRREMNEERAHDIERRDELATLIESLHDARDIVSRDARRTIDVCVSALDNERDTIARDIEHANDVIALFDATCDAFTRALRNIDTHAIDDVSHAHVTIEILSANDTRTFIIERDTRDDDAIDA